MPDINKYPRASFEDVKYYLDGEPTAIIEWYMNVDHSRKIVNKTHQAVYIKRFVKDRDGNKVIPVQAEFIKCAIHRIAIVGDNLEISFTTSEE